MSRAATGRAGRASAPLDPLRDHVRRTLRRLLPRRARAALCVAYSGGLDSTVLLALLARLQPTLGFALRAVHIDHGLHVDSATWARRARAQARRLGVSCRVVQARLAPRRGESVEAEARRARYRLLLAALRPHEILLTAQQLDDQAETVLLQLLRGAGPAGLAAMGEHSARDGHSLLRPLLAVPRAELAAWAEAERLEWSDDPSNAESRFDRNYLRHEVLPRVRARWPGFAPALARSAALAAESQQLLEQYVRLAMRHLRDGAELRASGLRALAPPLRRQALRAWLAERGAPLPDRARLDELAGPILQARDDAVPEVAWANVAVRRYDDRLFLLPRRAAAAPAALNWPWRRAPMLRLPGLGCLELRRTPFGDLDVAALPQTIAVRFRVGGERLAESDGHAALKQWLQQERVPPWQRARLPLLYSGRQLLAVAGCWLHPALRSRQRGGPPAPRHRRARLRFIADGD